MIHAQVVLQNYSEKKESPWSMPQFTTAAYTEAALPGSICEGERELIRKREKVFADHLLGDEAPPSEL